MRVVEREEDRLTDTSLTVMMTICHHLRTHLIALLGVANACMYAPVNSVGENVS